MDKATLLKIIEDDLHGLLSIQVDCEICSRYSCICSVCSFCEFKALIKPGADYCDECEDYISRREGKR